VKKITGTLTIAFTAFVPDDVADEVELFDDEICEALCEDPKAWEDHKLDVHEIASLTLGEALRFREDY